MDLGLSAEKVINHSKAALRSKFSNPSKVKKRALEPMGNYFGEIRVDVEYIDSVAEILHSLKNPILEEEKVGQESFPFKDDSSSAGNSSSKGQSSSHQSEKLLGNHSDLKTQPKNNASPWAALAGAGLST
jgi:hypothetical protein